MVVSNGRVVEQGSHDQLMSLQGTYYKLVTSNNSNSETDSALVNNALTESITDPIANEINEKIHETTLAEDVDVC